MECAITGCEREGRWHRVAPTVDLELMVRLCDHHWRMVGSAGTVEVPVERVVERVVEVPVDRVVVRERPPSRTEVSLRAERDQLAEQCAAQRQAIAYLQREVADLRSAPSARAWPPAAPLVLPRRNGRCLAPCPRHRGHRCRLDAGHVAGSPHDTRHAWWSRTERCDWSVTAMLAQPAG